MKAENKVASRSETLDSSPKTDYWADEFKDDLVKADTYELVNVVNMGEVDAVTGESVTVTYDGKVTIHDLLHSIVNGGEGNITHRHTIRSQKGSRAMMLEGLKKLQLPEPSVLPPVSLRKHGCLTCEWHGTMKCPYWTSPDRKAGHKLMPSRGICNKRVAWLLFLTPEFKERPSSVEWDEAFNMNRIELENIKDLQRLEKLNTKLDEVENSAIKGRVNESKVDMEYLRQRRAEVKTEYIEIAKLLLKAMTAKVDREKPKKIDITHERKVTPMDIADQLRRTSIDVDFTSSSTISSSSEREKDKDD